MCRGSTLECRKKSFTPQRPPRHCGQHSRWPSAHHRPGQSQPNDSSGYASHARAGPWAGPPAPGDNVAHGSPSGGWTRTSAAGASSMITCGPESVSACASCKRSARTASAAATANAMIAQVSVPLRSRRVTSWLPDEKQPRAARSSQAASGRQAYDKRGGLWRAAADVSIDLPACRNRSQKTAIPENSENRCFTDALGSGKIRLSGGGLPGKLPFS